MDVLLKQDVDLGFSLILPDSTKPASDVAASSSAKAQAAAKAAGKSATAKKPFYNGGGDAEDDIQKWNALLEIKSDEVWIWI